MHARQSAMTDDASLLRRCLNDLIGILAMPDLWGDGDPEKVSTTLLDVLSEMLSLEFLFVRFMDRENGSCIDRAWIGAMPNENLLIGELGAAIDTSIGSDPRYWPDRTTVHLDGTGIAVASARFGIHGELGGIVAGSARSDFPTDPEQLLLDVASNQAAIGYQHALNLTEQHRVARELDRRVEQQASELADASEALHAMRRDLRLIVDSIPGPVALLAADGDVEFVNRHILDYFGKTFEDLRRWAFNDAVHPDDLQHVTEVFGRAIVTGEPYEILQRFRRHDGEYRWFRNNGFPLQEENGIIDRWCVLLTDIDERERAVEALRASEREARTIVDSIPGLIATFTADGEVEFINRQNLEYFGRTLEDMKHWDEGDSTHPDDLPRVAEVFSRSIASGNPFVMEVRARRHDGVYRWLESRGYPHLNAEGEVVRWYNLLIDIDERKRAEDALSERERDLQLINDTIPVLAWTARPDGTADFFNRHYLEYIGLSAEQAANWGWTVAVHPDDMVGLATTWQRILESEALGEAEARIRRFDGEYRWFLFRANPLRDESGEIVRWYGVNTEIEERKRAEGELQRAYDSFADAQRLSKTGSFITDLVGDDHNWSDETYRIFGFTPGSLVSLGRIQALIHPDDLPTFGAMIGRAVTGEDVSFAFRITTDSGELKHIRGMAHVIEQVEGHPMFVGALQDVTEGMIAEEALNRARAELAHVSNMTTMSALTASIAHEVNQPLAGIVTNASTCLRMLDRVPPDVAGARETARRTIRDANRAADVISRLRDLFTRKEFAPEPLDLNDAVQEVLALSSTELQRHRVIVTAMLAPDLPPVVGDRVQLQQVILNLLRNAWDAMSEVYDRPRNLHISTNPDEGSVRLTVRDAGTGLASSHANSLFDAFYTTKHGGMGIGLFVSRSIVDRHQGTLWVEQNQDGPGASFSFTIPGATASILDRASRQGTPE